LFRLLAEYIRFNYLLSSAVVITLFLAWCATTGAIKPVASSK
jgi:hypothetical protein